MEMGNGRALILSLPPGKFCRPLYRLLTMSFDSAAEFSGDRRT
jgi:hypothetical protein